MTANAYPRQTIVLAINGETNVLTVEPRESLAEVLRDRLGLLGTKVSCDQQVCGACTVLVDGLPVSSCCHLAVDAEDRTVTTIEGIGAVGLHPVQTAFLELSAFQCGYCTPGFIVSAVALVDSGVELTRDSVAEWLAGNLCRCTGYAAIAEAVLRAAPGGSLERHDDE